MRRLHKKAVAALLANSLLLTAVVAITNGTTLADDPPSSGDCSFSFYTLKLHAVHDVVAPFSLIGWNIQSTVGAFNYSTEESADYRVLTYYKKTEQGDWEPAAVSHELEEEMDPLEFHLFSAHHGAVLFTPKYLDPQETDVWVKAELYINGAETPSKTIEAHLVRTDDDEWRLRGTSFCVHPAVSAGYFWVTISSDYDNDTTADHSYKYEFFNKDDEWQFFGTHTFPEQAWGRVSNRQLLSCQHANNGTMLFRRIRIPLDDNYPIEEFTIDVSAHCEEVMCSDNTDNDGDSLTDCADSDCSGTPSCSSSSSSTSSSTPMSSSSSSSSSSTPPVSSSSSSYGY